jgi:hypothetical protein
MKYVWNLLGILMVVYLITLIFGISFEPTDPVTNFNNTIDGIVNDAYGQ